MKKAGSLVKLKNANFFKKKWEKNGKKFTAGGIFSLKMKNALKIKGWIGG